MERGAAGRGAEGAWATYIPEQLCLAVLIYHVLSLLSSFFEFLPSSARSFHFQCSHFHFSFIFFWRLLCLPDPLISISRVELFLPFRLPFSLDLCISDVIVEGECAISATCALCFVLCRRFGCRAVAFSCACYVAGGQHWAGVSGDGVFFFGRPCNLPAAGGRGARGCWTAVMSYGFVRTPSSSSSSSSRSSSTYVVHAYICRS